jgi:hypothetical protein
MRHHGDTDSGTRNYCFAMGSMIVFSVDVRRLADFYEAVLGVTRTNVLVRLGVSFTMAVRTGTKAIDTCIADIAVSGHVKIPVGGQ